MKNLKLLSAIGNFLSIAVKYGAYVVVLVKVLQFAYDEFQALSEKENPPKTVENE